MPYRFRNFYEFVSENAERFPRRPALFEENTKVRWRDLKRLVDSFARYLELVGVRKGDNVAMLMGNSKEFVIALLAIGKLGAVPVPLNTFLKRAELEYILNDCGAKLLVTQGKFADLLKGIEESTEIEKLIWSEGAPRLDERNLSFEEGLTIEDHGHIEPQADLEDLAVMLYTSGTTGKPKGVMLTYRNILSNIENIVRVFDIKPKDRFIVYLPMFHAFTLTATVLLPLYTASPIVIVKSIMPFSNVIKQTLLKRVTVFMGVPEVFNALSKAKLPWYFMWFNRIRYFVSGGAPLPLDTLERMKRKFRRAVLLEGYGLSECSPVVSVNLPHRQKPLSVGPPLPDYEVKIVDEELMELPPGEVGEIIVKGDCVMKGYYNNPYETENTIINGWLRTGDLGYVDEEGFLYIVDRKKDLIICKGMNIYPREVEEVLMSYPRVELCAVVGKKDAHHGEIPIAFVKPVEGESPSEAELRDFLKERLANYKIPRQFIFVDDLPKNATGKVLKRVLREKLNKGEFDKVG